MTVNQTNLYYQVRQTILLIVFVWKLSEKAQLQPTKRHRLHFRVDNCRNLFQISLPSVQLSCEQEINDEIKVVFRQISKSASIIAIKQHMYCIIKCMYNHDLYCSNQLILNLNIWKSRVNNTVTIGNCL